MLGYMKVARWLLFAGVGLVGFSLYWYSKNSAWEQEATKVEGRVVEVVMESGGDSPTYKPRIRYVDLDGEEREFLHPIGQSPSPFKVGENVPVLLDPLTREPKLGTLIGLHFISFLTGVFGALLLIIYWLLNLSNHEKKLEELKRSGLLINAKVSLVRAERFQVNNKTPWIVEAQAQCPITFQQRTFKSRYLWEPPTLKAGEMVKVYVSRANPKKYCIDL